MMTEDDMTLRSSVEGTAIADAMRLVPNVRTLSLLCQLPPSDPMAYTLRMALKVTMLRMSEDLWDLLEEEAARQGVSAAHVVRDSVLLRLGHLSAARGDSARLSG